jgi:hypothetical protein
MVRHKDMGGTEEPLAATGVKQEYAKVGMEGSAQPSLGTIFQGNGPMHDRKRLVVRAREPREVMHAFHGMPKNLLGL